MVCETKGEEMMSEEKFIVGDADGPKLVPVETKDHSKEPKLMNDEQLRKHAEHEAETTKEVIGPMAISPELLKKAKRGRPKKENKPARNWRCGTCQEVFDDKNVMKIGAGTNRYAVFCPICQKSLGFEDPVVLETVDALIKNNPTGKNVQA